MNLFFLFGDGAFTRKKNYRNYMHHVLLRNDEVLHHALRAMMQFVFHHFLQVILHHQTKTRGPWATSLT
jgi:hypothetical protein